MCRKPQAAPNSQSLAGNFPLAVAPHPLGPVGANRLCTPQTHCQKRHHRQLQDWFNCCKENKTPAHGLYSGLKPFSLNCTKRRQHKHLYILSPFIILLLKLQHTLRKLQAMSPGLNGSWLAEWLKSSAQWTWLFPPPPPFSVFHVQIHEQKLYFPACLCLVLH